MNGYYQAIIDKLKEANFRLIRAGKGSHEIWGNGSRNVTVPFGSKSRFTANEIMKQAGIKHRFP